MVSEIVDIGLPVEQLRFRAVPCLDYAFEQMRGKLDRAGRTHRPAKAQLRDGKADLKWPGGRAGSK